MQQIAFRAMGCEMQVLLHSEQAVLAKVPRWFAVWERHLSRFLPDSELSRLNQQGFVQPANRVLWAVVDLALAQAHQTTGLITPTLLGALEAAGYDRSFEQLAAQVKSEPSTGNVLAWTAVERDPATRMIRLPAGLRLDLGGSAKGWAAQQVVARLARYGPVLVDAGGDIAVSGPQADGSPWPIAIADPHAPDQELELLLIDSGGVATSGCDYRRWLRDGHWQHHLIDPRTQRPAITDVLSATVVGPAVTECEAAAKRIVLQGCLAGLAWLETQPQLAALVVLEDRTVRRSQRLAAYCWSAEPKEVGDENVRNEQ